MRTKSIITGVFLALTLAISSAAPGFAAKPGSGGGVQQAPRTVCIDAGHGGAEPGTSNGGIIEKNLNLDVALRLNEVLTGIGYTTYMTRTSDVTLSKEDRYTFCNNTDSSVLLSVHHNGSSSSTADYTTTLYHSNSSLNLAKVVGQEVANEFGMGSTFRTERFANMMLMKSAMPSIINEGYFLTNGDRLSQLQADYSGMVDREANAMMRGLEAYYGV